MIDIAVKDLVKSFEIGDNLLDGLSFEIQEGECVAVLGRNGCGKTTLFRILTGEIGYDAGEVYVNPHKRLGLISQIPQYPAGYTVEEVLRSAFRNLLDMRRRMEELEAARKEAAERRARLEHYRTVEAECVELVREPERPYVFLEKDFILEKEVDFQLKRLEQRHQDYIQVIGSQCMGAAMDEESLKAGVYNHFSRVFFLTKPGLPFDDTLPAGEYARLYYRGPYERLQDHLKRLLARVEAAGRCPVGAPLELYRIDAHDTNLEAEYVTELQVKVTPTV